LSAGGVGLSAVLFVFLRCGDPVLMLLLGPLVIGLFLLIGGVRLADRAGGAARQAGDGGADG
jgi:hypothetical protein